jgi:division protein CdvB (Snf7/Vps24/ESCRT-III family)
MELAKARLNSIVMQLQEH